MKKFVADTLLRQVTRDYNTIAAHFSDTRNRHHAWSGVNTFVQEYVHPGDRVLDIGCGNGRVADVVNEIKGRYVGVDASQALLQCARQLHPTHVFVLGNVLEIPFSDGSFDHVLMIASFHHIPSVPYRYAALAEVSRVLAPGGMLCMMNWNLHQRRFFARRWQRNLHRICGELHLCQAQEMDQNDLRIPWKDAGGAVRAQRYYHGFTPRELARIARGSGFRVIDQFYETRGQRLSRWNAHNLVTILKK